MKGICFLIGAAFGFLLAATRLNDYTVIHNMLLLRDPQPYLIMGSAFAVAMPLLWLLQRRGWRTPLGGHLKLKQEKAERKHLVGAAIFGTGWAVTGACPGTIVAMVTGGTILGIATMAGLLAGIVLRNTVAARAVQYPVSAAVQPTP